MAALDLVATNTMDDDKSKLTSNINVTQKRSTRRPSSLSSDGSDDGKLNAATLSTPSAVGRGSDEPQVGKHNEWTRKEASAASPQADNDMNEVEPIKGNGQMDDITSTQNGSPHGTPTESACRATSPETLRAIAEIQRMDRKRAHFTRSKTRSGETKKDKSQTSSSKKEAESDQDENDESLDIDACAKILSRLDERSYQREVLRDANRLLEGIVLPMSLPWEHPVISHIKNIPRDIDEMPDILHLQDEAFAPFENGTFGYGKFETGKDVFKSFQPPHVKRNGECDEVRLAVRRSSDPGVIELTAMATPHPLSLSRNSKICAPGGATTSAMDHKSRAIVEADKLEQFAQVARVLGHGVSPTPRSLEELTTDMEQDDITVKGEMAYRNYKQAQENKRRKLELGMSYTSKLFVSLKVESVSSRSSIFPTCKSDKDGENKLRPLLSAATLPAEVQTGKHVSITTAIELDRAGLSARLGSYEVRYGSTSEGAMISKSGGKRKDSSKDSKGRAKRTFVGRGRLIWSSRTRGGGSSSASNSKFRYRSLLTGERMEGGTFKRPREIKVGVRINGNLLMTDTAEDETSPRSFKKVKAAGEEDEVYVAPSDKVIAAALNTACRIDTDMDALDQPNVPLQVSSFPRDIPQSSMCSLDFNELLKVAPGTRGRGRGRPLSSPSKKLPSSPASARAKMELQDKEKQTQPPYKPPRFVCLPLNEGTIRVVCTSPGQMEPRSVQQVLDSASRRDKASPVCSVCWSGNTSSGVAVYQCIDCGLVAHLNCCSEKGRTFPSQSQNGPTPASLVQSLQDTATTFSSIATTSNGVDKNKRWRCAACCHFDAQPTSAEPPVARKKSRRSTKLPRRFQGSETLLELAHSSNKNNNNSSPPKTPQKIKPPTVDLPCALCPHSGGAMSPMDDQRWAHEVCRIWNVNGRRQAADSSSTTTNRLLSLMTETCAICGIGNDPKTTRLVKCAARGCFVRFHPMCALLATKLEEENNTLDCKQEKEAGSTSKDKANDLEQTKQQDSQLCKQYTLAFVKCTRTEGSFGSIEGETKSNLLPVAFCGWHNPKRERTLYGCPPQGFGTAMRVPPIVMEG